MDLLVVFFCCNFNYTTDSYELLFFSYLSVALESIIHPNEKPRENSLGLKNADVIQIKLVRLSKSINNETGLFVDDGEFESGFAEGLHRICKTDVFGIADKCVYRSSADLQIQVFRTTDFQHGVKRVEQIVRIFCRKVVEFQPYVGYVVAHFVVGFVYAHC